MYKLWILALLLVSSVATMAQMEGELDTIYVSSTQIPLQIHETGRSISVLTDEALAGRPGLSFDEILQTIPGIEVQSRSGFGAQGDILVRGSTFTQVLVLIDGVRLNDPLTGHFNSYLPVSSAEIERIELIRGPAASIYGPDAVGGVINVITKIHGSDVASASPGHVMYGSEDLWDIAQGLWHQGDRLSIGAGAKWSRSDGELIPAKTLAGGSTLDAYRTFFDMKTASLSLNYTPTSRWSLRLRSGYDHRDFNARYFYTTSTFDKSVETTSTWFSTAQVTRSSELGQTDLVVSYKTNSDKFVFSPDFPSTNEHTTEMWQLQLNHLWVAKPSLTLRTGIQSNLRSIESNDRGNHADGYIGAYAMTAHRWGDLFHLSLGTRLDYDRHFDLQFLPQVNASLVWPGVVLRAGIGRSIRAADYTERFVSNNLVNLTPGRSLGNPFLKAESSWSEEIGADVHLSQNWQWSTTFFARQSSNLIDYVSTPASAIGNIGDLQADASYFFARNITDVSTLGVESFLRYQAQVSGDTRIALDLAYTYARTTNDEDIISVYISNHARHLLQINAGVDLHKWRFSVSGLYKERPARSAPGIETSLQSDYLVWNGKAEYRWSEKVGLRAQIHNIFDENYHNILGAKMPGRWLMGGLFWNLSGG